MKLAEAINKADELLGVAAREHAEGKHDDSLGHMMELRQLVNEPIELGDPGEDDTSENCTMCGQKKP